MKDKILRLGMLPLVGRETDSPAGRPRPLASPAPELDGVAGELRQLHDAYADHHDVPDQLAALAARVADAYERVGDSVATDRESDAPDGPASGRLN